VANGRSGVGKVANGAARRYGGSNGLVASFVTREMSRWRRLVCHILPVMVALTIGTVGMTAIKLVGDRYDPRSILTTQIVPLLSAPGSFVSVVYLVQDNRECHGIVHRWVIDSSGLIHAIGDVTVFHNFVVEFKKPYHFSRDFRIPRGAAAGPALYQARTERWCNFLQEWFWPIVDTESASFIISGGSGE
jgi:hypothetical protein